MLTVHDTLGVGPLAPAAADRHTHHRVALQRNRHRWTWFGGGLCFVACQERRPKQVVTWKVGGTNYTLEQQHSSTRHKQDAGDQTGR